MVAILEAIAAEHLGLVSLFNGISTFVGYLIPKQFSERTVVVLFNP